MRTVFSRLSTAEKFEPPTPRKPKVTPEKIKVTALNGHTISRCQHGSYWTEKYGPVYCETCCPGTSLRMIGAQDSPLNWSMPKLLTDRSPEHVYANPASQHGSKGQCPKCHCQYHVELAPGKWACPDCGHEWKGQADHATAANS